MDGIDAALFTIAPYAGDGEPEEHRVPRLLIELGHSRLHSFAPRLRKELQAMIAGSPASWEEVCRLNIALGEIFAEAALALIAQAGTDGRSIDLIGSHGQTIWHAPEQKDFHGVITSGTLQLGEPAVIAARTGIPVVGDFRPADMACGGQGAPLVSFADEVLFGAEGIATGVLNLGGIANITAIDQNGTACLAFDTGPANMLIDRACERLFNCQFDRNGELARQGQVDLEWLRQLLTLPYYKQVPPKTTGRELFGVNYADRLIDESINRGVKSNDCVATFTALSAKSIALAYHEFVQPVVRLERLVTGGGGADNSYLIELLSQFWPHPVKLMRHEDFGYSTKFKESMLFALLAYTTFFHVPNNVPSCTGANQRVCLGKLILPPVLNQSESGYSKKAEQRENT